MTFLPHVLQAVSSVCTPLDRTTHGTAGSAAERLEPYTRVFVDTSRKGRAALLLPDSEGEMMWAGTLPSRKIADNRASGRPLDLVASRPRSSRAPRCTDPTGWLSG